MRNIQPDIPGTWLVKWILVPAVILCIVGMILYAGVRSHKCKQLCTEKGYRESKWVAPGRFLSREQCICGEKTHADGTIDKEAKTVINLD
jgi:hypothetical protein